MSTTRERSGAAAAARPKRPFHRLGSAHARLHPRHGRRRPARNARPAPNVAEVLNVVGDVEGRDCLIPDDMIDTAGTVTEAARVLKGLGAEDIYVCATHALLSGPAVERLREAPIAEIAVTDTVAIPDDRRQLKQLKVLSVGELLAKAIRYTHFDQSVSSLFE